MEHTDVIIKPLVTEKTTHQQQTLSACAFQVHPRANKHDIKRAVEKIYEVKVVDVRTMNRKGKPRRARFKMSQTRNWKRAIVVLDENSRIDLF